MNIFQILKYGVKKILVVLTCALSFGAHAFNQSHLPEEFSDLPTYSVSFPKGTKSQTTYGIIRDHEGMMWFSTANGIERYDGLSFKNYSLSSTKMRHIRDGFQATLHMDRKGNIYAFTERSLVFRYNPETDVFDQIASLELQPDLHGVKCLISEGDVVHLGTTSGFRVFEPFADTLLYVVNEGEDVQQMVEYKNGKYLYGTDNFIGVYNPRKRTARMLCNINQNVVSLYYDEKRDLIWAGTSGSGVYVIDGKHPDRFLSLKGCENSIVTALEMLNDEYLLVGTDGEGLKICKVPNDSADFNDSLQLYTFADDSHNAPYTFPLSVVKGILCDDGHIWVSMDMGGLALMRSGGLFKRLSNPYALNVSDNTVFGADFDNEGMLWVAFNNSIGCYDRNGKIINIYMNHESRFLTVKHASDHTVWAGGYNTGLYHFDPKTGEREHIPSIADQPVLDCIWSVKEDVHKDIWIGGLNFPLTRLHFTEDRIDGKLQRKYERTFYPVSQVTDMLEINKDTMVVSTFDGFWIVDRNTAEVTRKLNDESVWKYTNCIGAVAVSDGHELWLATTGAGLLCYDLHTDKLESYNLDHGLPSIELRGVEMLNDTLLCASTENNGLFIFDAKNRKYVTAISQSEFSEISQFIRSASEASKDGTLLFGTDQGAVLFSINDIKVEHFSYKILVEGDYTKNDSIIHLPSSNRNINIEFTTNDIYEQATYHFEYRIKGLVNHWEKVDDSRRLRYMAVPPGRYTLEVKAIDPSNNVSEKQVKLIVDQDIYLRWYFILLYIVVIAALCFFTAVWAVNYTMARNDTQHGDIRSRLSFASISSLRQAKLNYRLIVKQSETDALTGLRNRYSGQKLITSILEQRQEGVLFIMDCDKFKHVNDTYGHIVGDDLLTQIARAMRNAFPNDITIRLGGDEFAVFMKGKLTVDEVRNNAERFFDHISRVHLKEAPDYVTSISVGGAFTPADEEISFETLYALADKHLYESKKIKGCSLVLPDDLKKEK